MHGNCQACFLESLLIFQKTWQKITCIQDYRSVGQFSGIFVGIVKLLFVIVRDIFLQLQSNFFLDPPHIFLGKKRNPNGITGEGLKALKEFFVIYIVNFCYINQHSDHMKYPFNFQQVQKVT